MKIIRNSRKYDRFHVKGLLRYAVAPDSPHFQTKNIHEIGEGGLSCLISQNLKPGTELILSALIFPRKTPIGLYAVVVGCHQTIKKPPLNRLCLRFIDVPEENQTILREILRRFLKNKKHRKPFPFALRFRD